MGALEGVATNYSLMILSQRVREVALSAARNREEAEGEVAGSGDGASGAAAERERDVKAAVVEKKKVLARRTFKSQNEPDLLPLLVSKRVPGAHLVELGAHLVEAGCRALIWSSWVLIWSSWVLEFLPTLVPRTYPPYRITIFLSTLRPSHPRSRRECFMALVCA